MISADLNISYTHLITLQMNKWGEGNVEKVDCLSSTVANEQEKKTPVSHVMYLNSTLLETVNYSLTFIDIT